MEDNSVTLFQLQKRYPKYFLTLSVYLPPDTSDGMRRSSPGGCVGYELRALDTCNPDPVARNSRSAHLVADVVGPAQAGHAEPPGGPAFLALVTLRR